MATSKNIRYIPAIDHLRAYAALLVLLYHCALLLVPLDYGQWPKAGNPFAALIYEGHTGVALFMVLSGFIFTYGSAGREIDYKTFLWNRVLRIYPLMIVLMFIGASAYGSKVDVIEMAANLLPLQNLHGPVSTVPLGVYNTLFWTIGVEFQFYLIFPFLYRQLLRRGILGLLPLMALLILARWSAVLLDASPRDVGYWTILGRLDQFLIGMIAATAARRLPPTTALLRWSLPVGVLGLGAALYLFNQAGGWPVDADWKILWPTLEAALWALIILGYLAVLHGRDHLIFRAIAGVGTVSYSLYLTHVIVISIVRDHNLAVHLSKLPFLSAVVTGLICVFPIVLVVSTLSYHVIEKPFLAIRRRYIAPEPNPHAALHAHPVATGDGVAEVATGSDRWLIACFAGVGAVILAAALLAGRQHAQNRDDAIVARRLRLSVEGAIVASDEARPQACKVLAVPDDYGPVAVEVSQPLVRAKEPFVVSGGRGIAAFGAQRGWQTLDAKALKNGFSPWYIVPPGVVRRGVPLTARQYPLRDGAMLSLTPPTLELSAVDSTTEIKFSSNGNAADYVLGGWASMDPGGTWTLERFVALVFRPQVVEGTNIEVYVDEVPFLVPALGINRQRIRLYFNGTPIDPEQQIVAAGTMRFTIPAAPWNAAAVAKADPQASLTFELPDATTPASLDPTGANRDIRKLGMFVSRVRLQVLP